jgi:hypothetical protein
VPPSVPPTVVPVVVPDVVVVEAEVPAVPLSPPEEAVPPVAPAEDPAVLPDPVALESTEVPNPPHPMMRAAAMITIRPRTLRLGSKFFIRFLKQKATK